jgi:YidC/Oxa1 family membrane protein insertase
MMNKRAIIAIVLTFLIISAWSIIQSKYFPPAPVKEAKKEDISFGEKPGEIKEGKVEKQIIPRSARQPVVTQRKEVTVETEKYLAVFSSEDARLKHFRLKKYMDRVEESGITIKVLGLVHGLLGKKVEEEKKPVPLDLVNTSEGEGLPLGLTLDGAPLSSQGEGFWEVDREGLLLLKNEETGEIVFRKTLANGLKVAKKYRFAARKEAVDLEVEIENPSSKEVAAQVGLDWTGKAELKRLADEGNKDFGLKYGYMKNQKVHVKDLAGTSGGGCTPGCQSQKTSVEPFETVERGEIGWFNFGGEYFVAILIPPSGEKNLTLKMSGDEKGIIRANLAAGPVAVAPGERKQVSYRVYLGPKEAEQLRALSVGAEKLVDFGYFDVVAKPLLWFLKITHHVTDNYGIDILILSILIKIIFLPLTQMSFKSMKEMQKVQPEMNRMKELYKNDKARQQQEIMLLYKRRKINPMSGCLPMVIQIPVFIALYNVLQNTIEMRHAPFFLWIQDLAARDPIYVTPIIMGASMVIQQKMTPTAADPAQAKLFLLMPVIFTFLFLNFPAGLVMYWLVNNVLSIAHQYYLNKKI